jgi:hypothetical protein
LRVERCPTPVFPPRAAAFLTSSVRP